MAGEQHHTFDLRPDVAALIRPAPAEWRRLVTLVVVALVVWAVANSTRPVTGGFGNGGGMSWEPGRPVTMQFDVTNTGILPVDVVGAVAPPGVRSVRILGGPVRLGPWSGGVVRFSAVVDDCRRLDRYQRTLTLKVRNLPVGWTREIDIEVPFTNPPAEVDGSPSGPETGWLANAIDANCPSG